MSSSLSSLVDNLSERLYNDKCTDCKSCLDYMSVKDDQLISVQNVIRIIIKSLIKI